jgi:hypothetical protein
MVRSGSGGGGGGGGVSQSDYQGDGMSTMGSQQRQLGDQDTTSQDKIMEHEKAGTPTDVRDVHF